MNLPDSELPDVRSEDKAAVCVNRDNGDKKVSITATLQP